MSNQVPDADLYETDAAHVEAWERWVNDRKALANATQRHAEELARRQSAFHIQPVNTEWMWMQQEIEQ